jgi:hypothetical protein
MAMYEATRSEIKLGGMVSKKKTKLVGFAINQMWGTCQDVCF